jgi:hypothetical protein
LAKPSGPSGASGLLPVLIGSKAAIKSKGNPQEKTPVCRQADELKYQPLWTEK